MAALGVARIIFTDITRDGRLNGVNADKTAQIARESGLKVIASGGVSTLEDIAALKKYESDGIEGFIIGKAIYTGALTLEKTIQAAKGDSHAG
jgi:phosphoribosylformimino-5-aminoimidazole carboxamide ribotide isomerase